MWPSQLKVCWEWLKLKQPLFFFFYYLHILIFGLLQLKHFFSLMQEKHIYRYIPVIVCFPYFFFNCPCFWSPTSYLYSVYRSAHFILREKCQLFVNYSNTFSVLVSNFFILDLEIGPFRALSDSYVRFSLHLQVSQS